MRILLLGLVLGSLLVPATVRAQFYPHGCHGRPDTPTCMNVASYQSPGFSYDVPSGVLSYRVEGSGYSNDSVSEAYWIDEFRIVGLAPNSEFVIYADWAIFGQGHAEYHPSTGYYGDSYAYASTEIGIRDERTGAENSRTYDTEGTAHDNLRIPIGVGGNHATFRLKMFARGRLRTRALSCTTQGDGKLSFSGLPPHTYIVSNGGYNNQLVPTHPTSWGQLKQRYR